MNAKVLLAAFFVLVVGLTFHANNVQAIGAANGTLPATPDGTLPEVTPTPGGTIPATETPGGTLPATETPGGTLPATATSTPQSSITPIVTGTPPGVPTPEVEPTTPGNGLPNPEAVVNLSIGVSKQSASYGDLIVFSILIGNISGSTLNELEVEVDTPTNTEFVANRSSPGWELVPLAVQSATAGREPASCPNGAGADVTCIIKLPGLMQNSIAIAEYAVRLDENTPAGASAIELEVRVRGADFNGALNRGTIVDIDPTRRQYMPIVQR